MILLKNSTMYQSYIKEIKAISNLIIKTQQKLDRLKGITRIPSGILEISKASLFKENTIIFKPLTDNEIKEMLIEIFYKK